jgi:hypothetical protein
MRSAGICCVCWSDVTQTDKTYPSPIVTAHEPPTQGEHMSRLKPRNFEEALDQLADDNRALWDALDNIVTLWEMEASMSDIENSVARARILLGNTAPKEETK